MDFDILDSLDDLGNSEPSEILLPKEQRFNFPEGDTFACLRYPGTLKDEEAIKESIEKGPKSVEFTQLVEWLTKELQTLNNLESCVNAITDVEDSSSFLLEISSFLKELNCPYKGLMEGPISQRLLDVQSRKTLIDYLCTELQAARILYPKKNTKNFLEIEMDDSSTAKLISDTMKSLNIECDVNNNPLSCFAEIERKVNKLIESKSHYLSPPILTETLTDEQWESLNKLYEDFYSEYTVRREMLLTRLDVTIQSFKWGEGSKGKEKKILNAYLNLREMLKIKPSVKLSDVIAARESLLVLEKTSSGNLVKNTSSAINKVLIPAVPDRGGRPKEQRPPVEMPNWCKRQGGGQGGNQHNRGGGGHKWSGQGKKFRGGGGGGGKRGGNFDAAGSY